MLELARELAAEAQAVATQYYGHAATRQKPNGSEVTEADLAIQGMMTERIVAEYPDHAIVGEEESRLCRHRSENAASEYCWVIDPVDGTRNYARGIPLFCTALAVLERGVPVVGLIRSLTTVDEYTATRGDGAWHNDRRLGAQATLPGRRLVVAVQSTADEQDARLWAALSGMALLRNLGSTALHMALVAAGSCDAAIAAECKLWDVAAGTLLVEEAGGLCTDWLGHLLFPVDVTSYRGQDLPFVAADRPTHANLLSTIRRVLSHSGQPPVAEV